MALPANWATTYRPDLSITRIECAVHTCHSFLMALTADIELMLEMNGWRDWGPGTWVCPHQHNVVKL